MSPEWIALAQQHGPSLIILLSFFWWATTKLIPQLQKERQDAIAAFERQMGEERTLHREGFNRLSDDCSKREERFISIIDRSLPAMAEAINNCAKQVSNHDLMTQGAITDAKNAFAHIRREHGEFKAALKKGEV